MLDNLNLTHMNGRVYDQVIGRFISADPFIPEPGLTQSFNRYSYVENNPLTLTDPSGFCKTDANDCMKILNSINGQRGPSPRGFSAFEYSENYRNVDVLPAGGQPFSSDVPSNDGPDETPRDPLNEVANQSITHVPTDILPGSRVGWIDYFRNAWDWVTEGTGVFVPMDSCADPAVCLPMFDEAGQVVMTELTRLDYIAAAAEATVIAGMAAKAASTTMKAASAGSKVVAAEAAAARAIGHSVDDLSRAAGALDKNGVSATAKALQSHFDRGGSAFPRITGNAASRNAAGQAVVDDILRSPGSTFTRRSTGRFGEVLDVRAPDGRGVRFGSDGSFIGLLEP
jgi:RHS repeat-associated protein